MSRVKFNYDKTIGIGPIAQNLCNNCECNRSALYIKRTIDIPNNRPLDILVEKDIIKKILGVPYRIGNSGLDKTEHFNVYVFYRPLRDYREYDITDPKHPILVDEEDDPTVINENDCLKLAENLAYLTQNPLIDRAEFEKLLQADSNPPFLQSKEGSITLGESSETIIRDNNHIIKKSKQKKNDNAIPMAGELYGILRNKETIGQSDFHIAFVIFSDSKHNITLEASADAGNSYCPNFKMWDLNGKNTFHNHFSGNLYLENNPDDDDDDIYDNFYTNGETVVLQLRDIATIEKELKKEEELKTSKKRKISASQCPCGRQRKTSKIGGRGLSITKSKKKNNSSSRKKKT